MQRLAKNSVWQRFVLVVMICFVLLMIGGMIAFPYAPLHREGAGFVDKLGHPHTAEYYARFRLWESSLFVVGSVFAVIAIGSAVHRYWQTGSLRIGPPRPNQTMQRTAGRSDV